MKANSIYIIFFLSLFILTLESILIDELDINILYFDLNYFKNEKNKSLTLSYYDTNHHYLKIYDENETLTKEYKGSYDEKVHSLIYYPNSDNYIFVKRPDISFLF